MIDGEITYEELMDWLDEESQNADNSNSNRSDYTTCSTHKIRS